MKARARAHPLLGSDALWPAGLPPRLDELTEDQRIALEVFVGFEGTFINDALRSGEPDEDSLHAHRYLRELARPLAPGAVLWRGGQWRAASAPGTTLECQHWTSCTLHQLIARMFRDGGGWDTDTKEQQALLRIECQGVLAVDAARLLMQHPEQRMRSQALEEQEIILAPSTQLTFQRVTRSGVVHLSATDSALVQAAA